MTRDLQGQTAVITGASSGLGAHFARRLASRGAAIALLARRRDRLDSLAKDLAADGHRALAVEIDLQDAGALEPALDRVESELGPVSIMINNAGRGGEGSALELTPGDFDQTFGLNVRAVFFGCQAAARRMFANGSAEGGQARILNIASIAAEKALPGLSVYCASKAAVVSLTRSLALEWARHGLAVNALCPGYIETEINADWFATEAGQRQVTRFPRRRLMDISALDGAFDLLTGPGSASMTGTAINVDEAQSL
ncbi:SDR family NAD(P)-dependent oxidoreductase [Maricaulis sp. CAU 1757]